MGAEIAERPGLDRAWWLRVPLVLTSPRHVFAALRDDSDEAAAARAEPVLAIVVLAGVAGVLATDLTGRIFDDPVFDPRDGSADVLLFAVWAFLAGALYGFSAVFLLGGLLHLGATLAGSAGAFRRTRHLLAFAAVPLLLSLLVWLVRVAVYGGDLLRRGGADEGLGNSVFEAVEAGFVVWSCALVVVGVRIVHGWTWRRSLAASLLLLALPALALADAADLLGL